MAMQYLLIGSSAASIGALNALRRLDPQAKITIISAEKELPYNKCLLAEYLAGSIAQTALSLSALQNESITWILGQKVIAIDVRNKQVYTDKQMHYPYDKLFLGMGSSPFIPQIPGVKTQGIFTFHTLADSNAILEYIKNNAVKDVVVIGAGLSGLEAADALRKYQLKITIIEKSAQVLPSLLSSSAAAFLHTKIQEHADLILNRCVIRFEELQGRITAVDLDSGQIIPADMVIIATGLRANTDLCISAGISFDCNGIAVNDHMQTSNEHIYAGGDLIAVKDILTSKLTRSCLWPDAMQQGMLAAHAMAGKPKAYAGATIITSSAFFGIKFARAGIIDPSKATIAKSDEYFHAFAVQGGMLTGFEVLGTRHNLGNLRRLLLTKQSITPEQITF